MLAPNGPLLHVHTKLYFLKTKQFLSIKKIKCCDNEHYSKSKSVYETLKKQQNYIPYMAFKWLALNLAIKANVLVFSSLIFVFQVKSNYALVLK